MCQVSAERKMAVVLWSIHGAGAGKGNNRGGNGSVLRPPKGRLMGQPNHRAVLAALL